MKKEELLKKLFNLCIEINGFEKGEKSPVIMFEFMGHVSVVNVSVHLNGWCTGEKADIVFNFYMDKEMYLESTILIAIETLEKLKKSLTC